MGGEGGIERFDAIGDQDRHTGQASQGQADHPKCWRVVDQIGLADRRRHARAGDIPLDHPNRRRSFKWRPPHGSIVLIEIVIVVVITIVLVFRLIPRIRVVCLVPGRLRLYHSAGLAGRSGLFPIGSVILPCVVILDRRNWPRTSSEVVAATCLSRRLCRIPIRPYRTLKPVDLVGRATSRRRDRSVSPCDLRPRTQRRFFVRILSRRFRLNIPEVLFRIVTLKRLGRSNSARSRGIWVWPIQAVAGGHSAGLLNCTGGSLERGGSPEGHRRHRPHCGVAILRSG